MNFGHLLGCDTVAIVEDEVKGSVELTHGPV